jgi:hypothetical protein
MENLFMMMDTIKNNSIIPMVDLPYAMVINSIVVKTFDL